MRCEKPEHPINFQINAACFLINHCKFYSELSMGCSRFLLMVEQGIKIAAESSSEFFTDKAPSRPWCLSL